MFHRSAWVLLSGLQHHLLPAEPLLPGRQLSSQIPVSSAISICVFFCCVAAEEGTNLLLSLPADPKIQMLVTAGPEQRCSDA